MLKLFLLQNLKQIIEVIRPGTQTLDFLNGRNLRSDGGMILQGNIRCY